MSRDVPAGTSEDSGGRKGGRKRYAIVCSIFKLEVLMLLKYKLVWNKNKLYRNIDVNVQLIQLAYFESINKHEVELGGSQAPFYLINTNIRNVMV